MGNHAFNAKLGRQDIEQARKAIAMATETAQRPFAKKDDCRYGKRQRAGIGKELCGLGSHPPGIEHRSAIHKQNRNGPGDCKEQKHAGDREDNTHNIFSCHLHPPHHRPHDLASHNKAPAP